MHIKVHNNEKLKFNKGEYNPRIDLFTILFYSNILQVRIRAESVLYPCPTCIRHAMRAIPAMFG